MGWSITRVPLGAPVFEGAGTAWVLGLCAWGLEPRSTPLVFTAAAQPPWGCFASPVLGPGASEVFRELTLRGQLPPL